MGYISLPLKGHINSWDHSGPVENDSCWAWEQGGTRSHAFSLREVKEMETLSQAGTDEMTQIIEAIINLTNLT